ncbi:MAG: hypothetical protein KDB35_15335 [Acidimicrobiales bacterium]|nr:hypothetical protein [Acidimicrobiales bacterium]MCB1013920.1 hypothetical protein [Acidimicrobiales bacterium]MCB9372511.1 glucose-6-phosphate isomerase [Microthrixaceae bacterium]
MEWLNTREGERLGALGPAVDEAIADLVARDAVARVWSGDHTLWQDDPTEVADRLGWLRVGPEIAAAQADLDAFAADVFAEGFTHVLVMGMGGSSLFPEVVASTFTRADDRPRLSVLDSTDPAAIGRVESSLDLDRTLFVASSKSGSTLETASHLAYFWEQVGRPEQFAVVTDAGSALEATARDRGFRRVFLNRPDIGGRYSALSYFGMVPAALAGIDELRLLRSADVLAAQLGPDGDPHRHPGLRLGAVMSAAVKAGRDKLTLLLDPEIATFGLWLEQLLAESTGKQGTGVVPVAGEEVADDLSAYGDDRLFVGLGWNPALDELADAGHPVVELPYENAYGLGAQVLLWEFATAICGAGLGINPFDQPNVAEAKAATNDVLARVTGDEGAAALAVDRQPLAGLLDQVRPGDYLSIQAYVDPEDPLVGDIDAVRHALRDRLGVATTLGVGPRFLHSTGQLHKGGPPSGVFVQVLDEDLPAGGGPAIPGQDFGFGTLIAAQAAGDLATLRAHGLRSGRVTLDDLLAAG